MKKIINKYWIRFCVWRCNRKLRSFVPNTDSEALVKKVVTHLLRQRNPSLNAGIFALDYPALRFFAPILVRAGLSRDKYNNLDFHLKTGNTVSLVALDQPEKFASRQFNVIGISEIEKASERNVLEAECRVRGGVHTQMYCTTSDSRHLYFPSKRSAGFINLSMRDYERFIRVSVKTI